MATTWILTALLQLNCLSMIQQQAKVVDVPKDHMVIELAPKPLFQKTYGDDLTIIKNLKENGHWDCELLWTETIELPFGKKVRWERVHKVVIDPVTKNKL